MTAQTLRMHQGHPVSDFGKPVDPSSSVSRPPHFATNGDRTPDTMDATPTSPTPSTKDEARGRRRTRDSDPADGEAEHSGDGEGGDAPGSSKRRRRSRKGLDKKFECPHDGCGKSYSRAEHLYRHQLNRKWHPFHLTWNITPQVNRFPARDAEVSLHLALYFEERKQHAPSTRTRSHPLSGIFRSESAQSSPNSGAAVASLTRETPRSRLPATSQRDDIIHCFANLQFVSQTTPSTYTTATFPTAIAPLCDRTSAPATRSATPRGARSSFERTTSCTM